MSDKLTMDDLTPDEIKLIEIKREESMKSWKDITPSKRWACQSKGIAIYKFNAMDRVLSSITTLIMLMASGFIIYVGSLQSGIVMLILMLSGAIMAVACIFIFKITVLKGGISR